jgi:tetratricopeptide (TPR) repeat protein
MRCNRQVWALAILLAAAVAARADDQVFYRDPESGKDAEARGVIEFEAPAGLRIKAKAGPLDVAATHVQAVVYQSDKLAALEFRGPVGKEERALLTGPREAAHRRSLLAEALEGYQDLDARARDDARVHRYLQYRIARVQALQAREDASRIDAAIAALRAYKDNFAAGWEVAPAMKLLAQLLEEKGDPAAASKVYDEMAALPGIGGEARQEAEAQSVRMLVRSGSYAEAEAKLRSLAGSAPRQGPRRALLDICLVQSRMAQGNLQEAEQRLREALQSTTDPVLRGVAYNLLGDYYRAKGQPDEAFWHYLRVDVIYNQDRQEHAKALFHLAKLYATARRDPVRAGECLRRLRGAEFAGTTYQREAGEADK